MAKRKKGSKVQKRAKLRRGNSAKRGKSRKAAQAKTVAKAKPKSTSVKKAARKVKQPIAPVVETVAVEVIEQPAPGVITVTEVEETEIRKASWHYLCDLSATLGKNYAFPVRNWLTALGRWADDARAALWSSHDIPQLLAGRLNLPGDIFMIRGSSEGIFPAH
jgi:hypothetical protein